MKKIFVLSAVIATAFMGAAAVNPTTAKAEPKLAEVWKSQSCGCCTSWIAYLEDHGYTVTTHDLDDVDPLKDQLKVPQAARSCHTAKIGKYVIEGHVPVEAIDKVMAEAPKGVIGIAAPGMPSGAPGMDADDSPYSVVTFGNGKITPLGQYP